MKETVNISDNQLKVLTLKGYGSVQDLFDAEMKAGVEELEKKAKVSFSDSIADATDEQKAQIAAILAIDPKDIPVATKAADAAEVKP